MTRGGWLRFACVVVLLASAAVAMDDPGGNALATVNGEPITAAEVKGELTAALGRRKLTDAAQKIYEEQTLEQLINRRVVQAHLNQTGTGATGAEVDHALQVRAAQLKAAGETVEDHLKKIGLTADQHRRQLAWQISWQRFLDRELTDAALEQHFKKRRRDFDGTRLRVSQILLKPPSADADQLEKTIVEAKKIRHWPAMSTMMNDVVIYPHAQAGKLNLLAVSHMRRNPEFPHTPTLTEAGFANADVPIWFAVWAPASTPADIIAALNRKIAEIGATPEMQARTRGISFALPDDFSIVAMQRFFDEDTMANAALIKEAKISLG